MARLEHCDAALRKPILLKIPQTLLLPILLQIAGQHRGETIVGHKQRDRILIDVIRVKVLRRGMDAGDRKLRPASVLPAPILPALILSALILPDPIFPSSRLYHTALTQIDHRDMPCPAEFQNPPLILPAPFLRRFSKIRHSDHADVVSFLQQPDQSIRVVRIVMRQHGEIQMTGSLLQQKWFELVLSQRSLTGTPTVNQN